MPNYRCCVGGCDNDSRYPDKIVKRSNVKELKFHYFPKDPEKRKLWVKEVEKGLIDFQVSNSKVVCSNHFEYGKPTFSSPIPTLYMSVHSASKPSKQESSLEDRTEWLMFFSHHLQDIESNTTAKEAVQCSDPMISAMIFADLTRDHDVTFFTGLSNSSTFKLVFEFLSKKATTMHYWKGKKNTSQNALAPRDLKNATLRSLSLEQELLSTLMRLRLGLLTDDLAHRFMISKGSMSCIFTTWLRLMCLEMKWLINWPDRHIIRRNLPSMFRKYYPKCCVIIDCSELFIETPIRGNCSLLPLIDDIVSVCAVLTNFMPPLCSDNI